MIIKEYDSKTTLFEKCKEILVKYAPRTTTYFDKQNAKS